MNKQTVHRSHSTKCRILPSKSTNTNKVLNRNISSSLPEAFVTSLRQLFSILDKTNSGYVPFDVFKRYFDCSSSNLNFLDQLEMESTSNNYLITFDLLINVIEQSLLSTKHLSSNSNSMAKTKRSLHRSTSVLVVSPKNEKIQRQIPINIGNSNELEINNSHASNPIYFVNKSQPNNGNDFAMV